MKIPTVYQYEVINLFHNFLWNISWMHTLFDPEMHHYFPPPKKMPSESLWHMSSTFYTLNDTSVMTSNTFLPLVYFSKSR